MKRSPCGSDFFMFPDRYAGKNFLFMTNYSLLQIGPALEFLSELLILKAAHFYFEISQHYNFPERKFLETWRCAFMSMLFQLTHKTVCPNYSSKVKVCSKFSSYSCFCFPYQLLHGQERKVLTNSEEYFACDASHSVPLKDTNDALY